MRFGLGILRLAPNVFWAMTPRELAAAHRALFGAIEPIERARFDELMTAYPDREPENGQKPR
jgi:uncharacterized phage protein (TIGR02216 family)